jgi:hypothetical protein
VTGRYDVGRSGVTAEEEEKWGRVDGKVSLNFFCLGIGVFFYFDFSVLKLSNIFVVFRLLTTLLS